MMQNYINQENSYTIILYSTLFGFLKFSVVCRVDQSVILQPFCIVTERYKNDGSIKITYKNWILEIHQIC